MSAIGRYVEIPFRKVGGTNEGKKNTGTAITTNKTAQVASGAMAALPAPLAIIATALDVSQLGKISGTAVVTIRDLCSEGPSEQAATFSGNVDSARSKLNNIRSERMESIRV